MTFRMPSLLLLALAVGCFPDAPTEPTTDAGSRSISHVLDPGQFAVDFSSYPANEPLHGLGWTRISAWDFAGTGSPPPSPNDWRTLSDGGSLGGIVATLTDPPSGGAFGSAEWWEARALRWDSLPILAPPLEMLTRIWIAPDSQNVGLAWFIEEPDGTGRLNATVLGISAGSVGLRRYYSSGGAMGWLPTALQSVLQPNSWAWVRLRHTVDDVEGTVQARVWQGALDVEPTVWHFEISAVALGPNGEPAAGVPPGIDGKAGLYVGGAAGTAAPMWDAFTLGVGGAPAPPPDTAVADPQAHLSCGGGTRGTTVSCVVVVEPATETFVVSRWSFAGGGFMFDVADTIATWEGKGVVSGLVSADILLNGMPLTVTDSLLITARTSGIWTQTHWESQITVRERQHGGNCGVTNRITPGARAGWTGALARDSICDGQRIMPIGNDGYTRAVGSGPNSGIWYVDSISFYFESATQLHPDAFPAATSYSVTGQDAQLCRRNLSLPPGPVAINFWTYNDSCRQVAGWSGFLDAQWNHEKQHFLQADSVLRLPTNNIYVELEQVIRGTEFDLLSGVRSIYDAIQGAASTAGGREPTGNWSTPWWIWKTDTGSGFILTSLSF